MEQQSNFSTLVGLGLLAAMIVAAAYFRATAIEVFLVVVLLICGAAFLWAHFSLRKLKVSVRGRDCCGFPGEVLEAEAELKNDKLLPLVWLEFRLPRTLRSCIGPAQENEDAEPLNSAENVPPITERFAWILPHQTLQWHQRVSAECRGVYPLAQAELCSGDGFGLTCRKRTADITGGARFVVYPAVRPVEVNNLIRTLRELERAKNGLYTDRTLISTVRDWQEGDSFRDVNWRILARTDSVQVNVHETLDTRRLCFIPDLYSFTRLQEIRSDSTIRTVRQVDKPALERMLSLMASLITALHGREVLCTMVIPEIGDTPARILIPEGQDGQVTALLTALAEIDYTGEETELPFDEMMDQHHLLGQMFLVSCDYVHALWHDAPELTEQLGAMRILQKPSAEDSGETVIFHETDFIA